MRRLLTAFIAVLLILGSVVPAQAAQDPVAGRPEMISTFGYEPNRHRIGQTMSWWLEIDRDPDAGDPNPGVSYSQPLLLPGPNGTTRVVVMSGTYLTSYVVDGDKVYKPNEIQGAWRTDVNNWKALPEDKRLASRSHTTYDVKGNLFVTGTTDGRLVYNDPDTGERTYPPTYLGSPEGIVSAPLVLYWQRSRF